MTNVRSAPARAVADLSEGSILAAVEIAAPPERIFRALTSAEITQWWGAERVYQTREWTGDVRVGGKWRSTGTGADGKPFAVHGEYVEIDPPRRLVHTWQADWDPDSITRVSYKLEPIATGTRLTLQHTGFTSQDSCRGHAEGWSLVLDWLAGFIVPVPRPQSFLIRLLPPRPTFIADMTPAERSTMMEHQVYWAKLLAEGTTIAFGPVADPRGAWGVGLLEVDSLEAVQAIEAGDPAVSQLGMTYEVLSMPVLVSRPRR
jgi:uncharacterized protein YndB with AHSA1/START domain/uncharacterized protein YciI